MKAEKRLVKNLNSGAEIPDGETVKYAWLGQTKPKPLIFYGIWGLSFAILAQIISQIYIRVVDKSDTSILEAGIFGGISGFIMFAVIVLIFQVKYIVIAVTEQKNIFVYRSSPLNLFKLKFSIVGKLEKITTPISDKLFVVDDSTGEKAWVHRKYSSAIKASYNFLNS